MRKKDKLNRILGIFKELKITGYDIALKTSLSEVGVNKIINGDSTNPHNSTIDILINYLEKHHQIDENWLNTEEGTKLLINLPTNEEWDLLTPSDKKQIMSKVSNFIAYHEEEAFADKILFNVVERNAYKLMIKMMKDQDDSLSK